jgi:hypothetical protein
MPENPSQAPLTAFPAGEYEAIIEALLGQGYVYVSLADVNPQMRHMFLRHDIDLCPERALEIATREAALGVSATYYFLVSTSLYSIASAETRRILQRIIELGHDIGLHFDAEQYAGESDQLDMFAERECQLLELCTERPVLSISFHRPAAAFLNRPALIAGRRHCYEPAFFSEIGYISDSNGSWSHGHPLDHPAVAAGTAIQLLTHPIWWCNAVAMSTVDTMSQLFADRRSALQAALAGTVTAYRKALEGDSELPSSPIRR